MCQQTQIATVLPYYARWMAAFPTVRALAEADLERVMAHWQGLGYYARGQRLHAAARDLASGQWPTDLAGWRAIPGIGPYTAGALASIVNGLPTPLVDGNVERVAARIAALDSTGAELRRAAWAWAQAVMVANDPGNWNQALMELGAKVCTPRRPRCPECPVQAHCQSWQAGRVDQRPAPRPKPVTRGVDLCVTITRRADGAWGLTKSVPGQWWAGLWVLPWTRAGEVMTVGPKDVVVRTVVTQHRIRLIASPADLGAMTGGELVWLGGVDLANVAVPTPFRRLMAAYAKAQGEPKV